MLIFTSAITSSFLLLFYPCMALCNVIGHFIIMDWGLQLWCGHGMRGQDNLSEWIIGLLKECLYCHSFQTAFNKNESMHICVMHQELKSTNHPWNKQWKLIRRQKADFWIIDLRFFKFIHRVSFLGHQCKELPKMSNICYSYAWGIRLNVFFLRQSWTLPAITQERKERCMSRDSLMNCKCTLDKQTSCCKSDIMQIHLMAKLNGKRWTRVIMPNNKG